jgi:hypothetical protein
MSASYIRDHGRESHGDTAAGKTLTGARAYTIINIRPD